MRSNIKRMTTKQCEKVVADYIQQKGLTVMTFCKTVVTDYWYTQCLLINDTTGVEIKIGRVSKNVEYRDFVNWGFDENMKRVI